MLGILSQQVESQSHGAAGGFGVEQGDPRPREPEDGPQPLAEAGAGAESAARQDQRGNDRERRAAGPPPAPPARRRDLTAAARPYLPARKSETVRSAERIKLRRVPFATSR